MVLEFNHNAVLGYKGALHALKAICTFSLHKVDNPYLVTSLIRTPIFEWLYVVWCGSTELVPNRHVFERDWTACSKYVNHSGLNKLGETI